MLELKKPFTDFSLIWIYFHAHRGHIFIQSEQKTLGNSCRLVTNSQEYHRKNFMISVIYCGFYGSSLAIFSIHFAYRYWVVSGTHQTVLNSFHKTTVLIWLIAPFSVGLIWALVGYFLCYPRASTTEHLNDNVRARLGLNISDIVYFAPYFYEKNEMGQNVIYWPSFIGIMLDSMSIVSFSYQF